MAYDWKITKSTIFAKFKTDIATPYGIQTQYENDGTFKVDEDNLGTYGAFAKVKVIHTSDNITGFDGGLGKRIRTEGVFIVEFHGELNVGEDKVTEIADLTKNAFETKSENSITYRAATPQQSRRVKDKWMVPVSIPFITDRHQT